MVGGVPSRALPSREPFTNCALRTQVPIWSSSLNACGYCTIGTTAAHSSSPYGWSPFAFGSFARLYVAHPSLSSPRSVERI